MHIPFYWYLDRHKSCSIYFASLSLWFFEYCLLFPLSAAGISLTLFFLFLCCCCCCSYYGRLLLLLPDATAIQCLNPGIIPGIFFRFCTLFTLSCGFSSISISYSATLCVCLRLCGLWLSSGGLYSLCIIYKCLICVLLRFLQLCFMKIFRLNCSG